MKNLNYNNKNIERKCFNRRNIFKSIAVSVDDVDKFALKEMKKIRPINILGRIG